jgi:hypothetical protein
MALTARTLDAEVRYPTAPRPEHNEVQRRVRHAHAALAVLPRTAVALVVDLGLRGAISGVALAYAAWLSLRVPLRACQQQPRHLGNGARALPLTDRVNTHNEVRRKHPTRPVSHSLHQNVVTRVSMHAQVQRVPSTTWHRRRAP